MKSKETKRRRNSKRKRFFFAFVFFVFLILLLNINCGSILSAKRDLSLSNNGYFLNYAQAISILPDSEWFISGINWLLYSVFKFFSYLLGLAGLIFDWVVNADNVKDVLTRNSIYTVWKIVRDFLNLFFILVLLFSAFCTVFQVEQYHLKKVILTLIIMALLVNFSFPISRFIIDASNITMYYFFSSVFPESSSSSISATFVRFTNIADILVPKNSGGGFDSSGPTSQLIMAIIFIFILMVTILVIAIMFVIRLIALAILIIFSPIGFIGIIPGKIQGYANDWWTNLFKYAFFGPIMAFMLVVAYYLMADMAVETNANSTFNAIKRTAQNFQPYGSSGTDAGMLANMAYFAIPIVILWMGLIVAQKMGIYGANYVTGKAENLAKWGTGYSWVGKRFDAYRTERKRRQDEAFQGNLGERLGKFFGRAQDKMFAGGKIPGLGIQIGSRAAKGRLENLHNSEVRGYMRNYEDISNGDELANRFSMARNKAEKEAIFRRAASVGETDTMLNRAGYSDNREGLAAFTEKHFGGGDDSARLAASVATLEARRRNTQYVGSSVYDKASNKYKFVPGTVKPGDLVAGLQFSATGGKHPEGVARNIGPGFVVTYTPQPAGSPKPQYTFNQDFDNFLENMGKDFNSEGGLLTPKQINQIPNDVIRRMQKALDEKDVVMTPKIKELITALKRGKRLKDNNENPGITTA